MVGKCAHKFVDIARDKLLALFFTKRIFINLLIGALRRRTAKPLNIENLIEIAFYFPFGLKGPIPLLWPLTILPSQKEREIFTLLKKMKENSTKNILEIGTILGGTLFLFSNVTKPDGKIISIDLPAGLFGGGYPEWKMPFYQSFARKQQTLVLLRCDSHSSTAVNSVIQTLQDEKLDFVFIDGDHTYEGVKADFNLYSPFVKKGGMIAFHDVATGSTEKVGGVPKFWGELKQSYRHLEIIENQGQGFGIGIVFT